MSEPHCDGETVILSRLFRVTRLIDALFKGERLCVIKEIKRDGVGYIPNGGFMEAFNCYRRKNQQFQLSSMENKRISHWNAYFLRVRMWLVFINEIFEEHLIN